MNKVIIQLFFLTCINYLIYAQNSNEVSITHVGHACFLITTSHNTKIVTDPIRFFGYEIPDNYIADIVTVSHNHGDHNAVNAVSGKPNIFYGIDKNGREPFQEFVQINETVNDVKISNVSSNHSPPAYSPQLNSIFIFEFDGIRIAHLGDIGLILTQEQLKKLGVIDILMIPVGGKFTVSLEDADKIVNQIKPRIAVIPMHYRTRTTEFLPNTVDDFIKGKKNVEIISGNTYKPDLEKNYIHMKYVVFNPINCFGSAKIGR